MVSIGGSEKIPEDIPEVAEVIMSHTAIHDRTGNCNLSPQGVKSPSTNFEKKISIVEVIINL